MVNLGIRRRFLLSESAGVVRRHAVEKFSTASQKVKHRLALAIKKGEPGDFNWRLIRGVRYVQSFLNTDPQRSVSVRIDEQGGALIVGCRPEGMMSPRFEYPIPVAEAHHMLSQCRGPRLDRVSRRFCYGALFWCIDEYTGDNAGLIIAEVEGEGGINDIDLPHWVGEEITSDPNYSDEQLLSRPWRSRRHSALQETPLQPCPFCGACVCVELTNTEKENLLDQRVWVFDLVRCQDTRHKGGCGAQGGWADSPQEAAINWNRRTNLRSLAQIQLGPQENDDASTSTKNASRARSSGSV